MNFQIPEDGVYTREHSRFLYENRKDPRFLKLLRGAHTIDLRYCGKEVKDVSCFENSKIQKLDLGWCTDIVDVSVLGTCTSLKDLDLSYCLGVKDVNCLGNVESLCLENCIGVSDVSGLGKAKELYLGFCPKISDVSALRNVDTLFLNCCPSLKKVDMLLGVKHLDLSFCDNLDNESVEILKKKKKLHYKLDMTGCPESFGKK